MFQFSIVIIFCLELGGEFTLRLSALEPNAELLCALPLSASALGEGPNFHVSLLCSEHAETSNSSLLD